MNIFQIYYLQNDVIIFHNLYAFLQNIFSVLVKKFPNKVSIQFSQQLYNFKVSFGGQDNFVPIVIDTKSTFKLVVKLESKKLVKFNDTKATSNLNNSQMPYLRSIAIFRRNLILDYILQYIQSIFTFQVKKKKKKNLPQGVRGKWGIFSSHHCVVNLKVLENTQK